MTYSVRRIAANASAAVVGEAISKGGAFLATVIVARSVTQADFGRFSFVLALVSFALLASDVGLQVTATRAVAADRRRGAEYATAAMAIGLIVGGGLYAGVLVGATTGVLPHGVAGASMVFGAVLLLAAPINAWWAFLRGRERQDLVYGLYALSTIVLVVAVALAVRRGSSIEQIFAVYVLAYGFRLASTIVLVRIVAPFRLRLTRRAIMSLTVAAPAVAVAYALQEVYSHVDVVLLGFLVSPDDVGSYAAAYRLIDAVTFLTAGALSAATFPVFARLAREAPHEVEQLYDRAVRVITVMLVPASLLVIAVSGPLVDLVFSFEDDTAARILALLAPSSLLIAINFTTMYLALAVNLVRGAIASAGAGALVNITTNVLAVPVIGVEAAAAATLMGEIVVTIAFVVVLKRAGFATHSGRTVLFAAVALLPAFVLAGALPSHHVEIALAGIPFAAGVLFAGGVIRTGDLRKLLSMRGQRRGVERVHDAGS